MEIFYPKKNCSFQLDKKNNYYDNFDKKGK